MLELCTILQSIAKCSQKLGIVRSSHEGCDVTTYKSGRIYVHGVGSEEEAIKFIDAIKFTIKGAFIDWFIL